MTTLRRLGAIACAASMIVSVPPMPVPASSTKRERTVSCRPIDGLGRGSRHRSLVASARNATGRWPRRRLAQVAVEIRICWDRFVLQYCDGRGHERCQASSPTRCISSSRTMVMPKRPEAADLGGRLDPICPRHFSTVARRSRPSAREPFRIVAPELPGGKKAGGHLSVADASGDSAIFEYIAGKLVIHHDRKIHRDDQLADLQRAAGDRELLARRQRPHIPARHDRLRGPVCPHELEPGSGTEGEGSSPGSRHRLFPDPDHLDAARPC